MNRNSDMEMLTRQLRALGSPHTPVRDLWPDIAARLQPRRSRVSVSLAAAALLLASVGLGVLQRPPRMPMIHGLPHGFVAAAQLSDARLLTREYRAARHNVFMLAHDRSAGPGAESGDDVRRSLAALDSAETNLYAAMTRSTNPAMLTRLLAGVEDKRLFLLIQYLKGADS